MHRLRSGRGPGGRQAGDLFDRAATLVAAIDVCPVQSLASLARTRKVLAAKLKPILAAQKRPFLLEHGARNLTDVVCPGCQGPLAARGWYDTEHTTAQEWKDAHPDPWESEDEWSEGEDDEACTPPSAEALAQPMALFTELGVERVSDGPFPSYITVGATLTCHSSSCESAYSEVHAWRRRYY